MNEYIKIDKYGKYYYKDKERKILHREDGPAVEYANDEARWYINGKRHRMDGPAVVWSGGRNKWYINGVFIFDVDKSGNIVDRMK